MARSSSDAEGDVDAIEIIPDHRCADGRECDERPLSHTGRALFDSICLGIKKRPRNLRGRFYWLPELGKSGQLWLAKVRFD